MSVFQNSVYNNLDFFNALFSEARENSVLLLDTGGMILEVNKAFLMSFGYEREDVCGKSFSMLFTDEDLQKKKPENEIATVVSQGQAFDNNYLLQKDGIITWVSGESTLIKNDDGELFILKIIQDINEHKISEKSIVTLNNFNESVLKSIEDGVVVLNEELIISKCNNAFLKLFNIPDINRSNNNFATLLAAYDKTSELLHKISIVFKTRTGFSNAVIHVNFNTDSEKILEVRCSPIKANEESMRVLVIIRDITMQKLIERNKEDMLGFIGHELKNPVATLLMSHNMMEELIDAGDMLSVKKVLERSKKNVLLVNDMISELYKSTVINAGNFKLNNTRFHFAEMVIEAADTMKSLHPDNNIIIRNLADDAIAYGDRYRLIQVVTNYLSNSFKYTKDIKDISITISQKNNDLEVAVEDKGIGIHPSQLPYIFDRFFRAEKVKELEGIGLGLFLCKQIIHAHQGQVWAESTPDHGSTFYFSIPVNQ